MRGKDEWGTLQLMSNTRDLRERRVREGGEEGERGGEEGERGGREGERR